MGYRDPSARFGGHKRIFGVDSRFAETSAPRGASNELAAKRDPSMKVIEFRSDYHNHAGGEVLERAPEENSGVPLEEHGAPSAASSGPTEARSSRRSLGAWVLLGFLRFYIVCLAPVFGGACRFYPSCSNYAVEAITKHGARRGFALAAKRLLRCRPFTQGGFDPVPDDLPHSKKTRRASRKLEVVSGTEMKIRETERRML